jgi:hypothetical protein
MLAHERDLGTVFNDKRSQILLTSLHPAFGHISSRLPEGLGMEGRHGIRVEDREGQAAVEAYQTQFGVEPSLTLTVALAEALPLPVTSAEV